MKLTLKPTLVLFFVIISGVLPFVLPNYALSFIAGSFLLAILAATLDIAWGLAGILILGPSLFFGIGAYFCAIALNHNINILYALLLLYIFILILCILVFLPCFFRGMKSIQFGLISLIISLGFQQIIISLYDTTGGSNGLINIMPEYLFFMSFKIYSIYFFFFISLLFCTGILVLLIYLERSQLGKLLICIRDDPKRAECLGFHIPKYQFQVFLLLAFVGATSGFIYAPISGIIHPGLFSITNNVMILVWLAIGGKGTILGPFFTAIILMIIEYLLGSNLHNYYVLITGFLLVLSVLFFRNGLFHTIFKNKNSI